MSGHSKFANIAHKKAANDAAKGKIFTRLGKELMIAVKEGGPDVNNNSKLRQVVAKCKAANMPNDTIDRAIKKAASNDMSNYESVTYEGYGPNGTAIIVEALTDNRNRAASNIRSAFTKGGGNVGTPGCVSFMFDNKGQMIVDKEEYTGDADELMMLALDVSIRAQVLNLLKKFQREKDLTYLFIAHDLSIVRFISDRIAVIYKGDIVEIADAEELFNFPLHPYTHSLISAIPIPDPQLEKNKVLFTYDPSIHDYSTDKPELVCIGHDHWVFGNKKEIEEYKATREKNVPLKTITILDKDAPRPEEHHDNVAHDEIQLPPLHDTGSAWYALLSFLLPVIGIIAAMIFKKHRHYRNYKMCKKGAIAGFIVLAVILALFLLALAAVFI